MLYAAQYSTSSKSRKRCKVCADVREGTVRNGRKIFYAAYTAIYAIKEEMAQRNRAHAERSSFFHPSIDWKEGRRQPTFLKPPSLGRPKDKTAQKPLSNTRPPPIHASM